MHDAVLTFLRCPLCRGSLAAPVPSPSRGESAAGGSAPPRGSALRCPQGHAFDLARQGYANLTTGRSPHSGDSADMVAARERFLAAGHFDILAAAVATAAGDAYPGAGLVLDAGTGTGYYLHTVLTALPEAVGLGLDVSKPALRRAARAHPRAGAALADVWAGLPLADASAGVILNVFAPRNGPEFRRVLRPDGALVTVTPTADHLAELVAALALLRVDPDKAGRMAAGLADHFAAEAHRTVRRTLHLTHDEVRTVIGMGPSAWHMDTERLAAAVAALPEPVTVTAAVELTVHRPRS